MASDNSVKLRPIKPEDYVLLEPMIFQFGEIKVVLPNVNTKWAWEKTKQVMDLLMQSEETFTEPEKHRK